jgi:hypothetical protein
MRNQVQIASDSGRDRSLFDSIEIGGRFHLNTHPKATINYFVIVQINVQ